MRFKLSILTILVSLASATLAYGYESAPVTNNGQAQVTTVNPSASLYQNAQKGWFFYQEPVKPKPPKTPLLPIMPKVGAPPPPKSRSCAKMATWKPKCGFVNPGTSFAFQSKERDGLLRRMAMAPDNPQAVENFQYYQKWVLQRSIEVANEWYYNTVQNPSLDATVKDPINAFGLKLMTEVKSSSQSAILRALRRQHALFVYFSKYSCSFCNAMDPLLLDVQRDTGIKVWNADLDNHCMPGFSKQCVKGSEVIKPAEDLRVTIVPTVFLYVPPSTWLRVSTGITDVKTIEDRATSFFSAYRTALLKGVANGAAGRPSVDFSGDSATGIATGVSVKKKFKAPTQIQINSLLRVKENNQ